MNDILTAYLAVATAWLVLGTLFTALVYTHTTGRAESRPSPSPA